MKTFSTFTAIAMTFVIAAAALAWVPKKDIKAERAGPASFKLTGTNTLGKLDVLIEDKHLFQGFKGEGTNGEKKVTLQIKSAGLGAGWKIEGKIGEEIIEMNAKQQGAFSKEWKVTGKVGERKIDETIDGDWDVDPVIVAALVAFDF